MTALAQARGTTPRVLKYFQFVLANGVVAFPGAAIFWDPVNAVATIGSANPALKYLGRCAEDVSAVTGNAGGTVKVNVDLDTEIVLTYFANGTSTDACVLATDFLKTAFALDDQTVSRLPSGKPAIGTIWDVDPIKGVGVAKFVSQPASGELPVVALAAFVANALAPAAGVLVNGAVHDVNTTAGVSTITLPAASPDGTILYFRADGTKNGHTVQYLDATGAGALTAALTASKRHLVTAIKLGTVWTAAGNASP